MEHRETLPPGQARTREARAKDGDYLGGGKKRKRKHVEPAQAAPVPAAPQPLAPVEGPKPLAGNGLGAAEAAVGAASATVKSERAYIKWSSAEDATLRKAVAEIGTKNWKRISTEFFSGERSHLQCLNRWEKGLKPGIRKGFWTEEEDAMVRECIMAGNTKWSSIAAKIPGRIGGRTNE